MFVKQNLHKKYRTMIRCVHVALLTAIVSLVAEAQDVVDYEFSAIGNASTGNFAPYMIGSLNGGKTVRKNTAIVDMGVYARLDSTRRTSWGAGAEIISGYSSANEYKRWEADQSTWTSDCNKPSAAWIQQLYGELKYRSVLVRVGQKEPHSAMLDETISSGDLTRSCNARGVPGVSAGFIDFQDIPFTRGFIQIDGVVDYGKFTDNRFRREQYNYYNWLYTQNTFYTYKRCYFRVLPKARITFTLGMQTAGQFGGSTDYYKDGELVRVDKRGFKIVDVFKMFLPIEGNGNAFYEGNTLGSWDFMARYKIASDHQISAGFQWPWEDGSGIGHRNGWDGLWGVYYHALKPNFVTGIAMEYLDFRNQSGPIHWAPGDHPGTTITTDASGGDNYYNNDTYCAYTNYGMAIATPFLVAPIYNLNGFPAFMRNCSRGAHVAIKGYLAPTVDYALKYSYQKAWGYGRVPSSRSYTDNSVILSVGWKAIQTAGSLKINSSIAYDAGTLRGKNLGFMIGVTYSGKHKVKK